MAPPNYIHLYISKAVHFPLKYPESSLFRSVNTNKEELGENEQNLQNSHPNMFWKKAEPYSTKGVKAPGPSNSHLRGEEREKKGWPNLQPQNHDTQLSSHMEDRMRVQFLAPHLSSS